MSHGVIPLNGRPFPPRRSEVEVSPREMRVGGDRVLFRDGTIVEPPIGAVLRISGQLQNSYGGARGKTYDYAVIRAGNGRWYTTGSSCPTFGYSWAGLLQFLSTFIDPTGERLA